MESKTRYFLGAIIVVCAIGIMILNYFTNKGFDSYIIPFILLPFSVTVFLAKHKKEKTDIRLSKKQQKIILPIVSVTLIAGIITFLTTLF